MPRIHPRLVRLRRLNLHHLLSREPLSMEPQARIAMLASQLRCAPEVLNALLDGTKEVTHRMANDFEKWRRLPLGWLDQEHDE